MKKLIKNKRKIRKKIKFYLFCSLMLTFLIYIVVFFPHNVTNKNIIAEDISPPPLMLIAEFQPRYGFTDEDIYLLAQVLSGGKNIDGDGEYDIDFQKEINYYEVGKVLGVIMNRVRSNEFPNTVRDVILQKGQFCVIPYNLTKEPSDRAIQTVREWAIAYDNHNSFIQVIPTTHLYFTGNGIINETRIKYR